jgi:hypothetical protein
MGQSQEWVSDYNIPTQDLVILWPETWSPAGKVSVQKAGRPFCGLRGKRRERERGRRDETCPQTSAPPGGVYYPALRTRTARLIPDPRHPGSLNSCKEREMRGPAPRPESRPGRGGWRNRHLLPREVRSWGQDSGTPFYPPLARELGQDRSPPPALGGGSLGPHKNATRMGGSARATVTGGWRHFRQPTWACLLQFTSWGCGPSQ